MLKDLLALSWEVRPYGSATKVAEGVIDMRLGQDGGDKVIAGYYAAPLDPLALKMDPGAYEIIWHFQAPIPTGMSMYPPSPPPWYPPQPTRSVSYCFEVLDPKYFHSSGSYLSYIPSTQKQLAAWDLHERQMGIERACREVDRLTMRFFFPRYFEMAISIHHETRKIFLDMPIIGISKMMLIGGSPVVGIMTETQIGLQGIRAYNRHLQGVTSPDDRDDPIVEYLPVAGEELLEYGLARFPIGSQNVKITGAFGYTDPDGGPFGEIPKPLRDVVLVLAYRFIKDPMGEDRLLWFPDRVQSAKTRDQSIGLSSLKPSALSLTGDIRLDSILAQYCRPFHIGVAGG
jgi:hypothetical protein